MNSRDTSVYWFNNEKHTQVAIWAILAVFVAIGIYLRINCLGCLGYRWDEDLTALAVKALSQTGIPELPSGMIYLRFYPYQWLLVLSTSVLGMNEFGIRLPSVVFGATIILVAYWLVSRVANRRTALIVAAAVTVSFTEVEMARTARMYAPFFVVYALSAYAIYRAYFENPDKLFSPWPLLLTAVALSIHQLAYSLGLFYLLAITINPSRARFISLFAQATLVAVGFLFVQKVHEFFFYRAARLANESGLLDEQDTNSGGIFQAVLGQISIPDFGLLQQTLLLAPISAIGLLLTLLFVSSTVWIFRAGAGTHWYLKGIAVFSLLFALGHQLNLAFIGLLVQLVFLRQGVAGMRTPIWRATAISCGSFAFVWVVIVILATRFQVVDLPLASDGFRKTLRLLIDYPNFRLFWSFPLEHPILAVPLALGTIWGIDKISRKTIDPSALFLVGGFWLVLFVNGILRTKFEYLRYNLHLDVFFLAICAIGVLKWDQVLHVVRPDYVIDVSAKYRQCISAVLATALLIISVNPLAAYLTSHRDYHEPGRLFAAFELDTYPDFATPAQHVKRNLGVDDRILVLDPREYWNYIGRVDYWVYSDNYQSQAFEVDGTYYDQYLGIPVLPDLSSVQSVLKQTEVNDIWIIYSQSRLARTRWISDPLKNFFRSLEGQIDYTGRDLETVVIRLPPDHPSRR